MITIEVLTEDRFEDFLGLVSQLVEESPYYKSNIDFEHLEKYLSDAVPSPSKMIIIAIDGDVLVGAGVFKLATYCWTAEQVGAEDFIYVAPDYRSVGIGGSIINAGLQWFASIGVTIISMGVNSGINTYAEDIYGKAKLTKTGSLYLGRLK